MKTFLLSLLVSIPCFALRFTSFQVVTNAPMTANVYSTIVDMNQQTNASFQATFTGSPVGTLELQFSDALVSTPCTQLPQSAFSVYTGSAEAISGPGTFAYNLLESGYRCIQLVYVFTSGSGTLNVTFSGKGP